LLPDLQSNALPISLHLYELHQILYWLLSNSSISTFKSLTLQKLARLK
jgi:hypothetical protein